MQWLFIGGLGNGFLVLLFSSENGQKPKKLMGVKKCLFVCPVPYVVLYPVTAFVIETCMYTKYPDPLLHTTPFTGIHYSALRRPLTMLHKIVPTLDWYFFNVYSMFIIKWEDITDHVFYNWEAAGTLKRMFLITELINFFCLSFNAQCYPRK